MSDPVIPDATLIEDVDLLHARDSAWRVMLFKNDIEPDEDTEYDDLEEADFSGYARVTPSFGSAEVTDHVARSDADLCIFTHDGGGTANDIYGAALLDVTGGTPYPEVIARFDGDPITMEALHDKIKVAISDLLRQYQPE